MPQGQQALLGARRVGVRVPQGLRRPLAARVGIATGVEHLVGEGDPVAGIDQGAADEPLVDLEVAQRVEHPTRRGDVWADPVAGKRDDPARHLLGPSGGDVESDVIEHERPRHRAQHRVDELVVELLGQALELLGEARRANGAGSDGA